MAFENDNDCGEDNPALKVHIVIIQSSVFNKQEEHKVINRQPTGS